jgi:TRAP-type C4-dicarboxylate transport system permease small subunit
MQGFVRLMDRIAVATAVVAAVLLAIAALLITWMVFWRAMGNSAWWEIEFSVYLMVAGLFLASPYTLMTKGHVGIDLASAFLPPGAARKLSFVVAVLGLLVCAYLTWAGAGMAWEAFERGDRSESTWAPYKWPLYLTLPVGLGLTALQYLAEMMRPGVADEAA